MLDFLFKFFLLAFITEAFTEIIVSRIIFEKIREKLMGWSSFLKGLLSCGACFSVWVAIGLCYLFSLRLGFGANPIIFWAEPFFIGLGVHRLSTWMHVAYMAFKQGPQIHLNKFHTIQNINEINEKDEDN